MKKYLILLFAALALNVSAQDTQGSNSEKREGAKRGMMHRGKKDFTANLSEEAKKTYEALAKEYSQEKKAIREKYRIQKPEKGQKPTEAQMDEIMEKRYACRKALLNLEEKYYGKFRKFLTPWQAAQAVKAGDFNGRHNNRKAFRGGNHGKKHQFGKKRHDAKCYAKCDDCSKKDCSKNKCHTNDCHKMHECSAKQ
ncbi:MAG: hypothetical protein IKL71_07125 [Bacteroidaceae bacterium]|nr:hypothetical protein [Bacteroidaceae bacterium]